MRTRSVVVAFTAVLVALLGACGGEAGDAEPTPTPSRSTEPSGSPSPPATPSPPTAAPSLPSLPPGSPPVVVRPPPDKPGETTLTGQVYAGVEANCKLLRTGSGDYLLIGEAAEVARLGSTVTVRGQVRADMATTCQQGTPFEVSAVSEVPD